MCVSVQRQALRSGHGCLNSLVLSQSQSPSTPSLSLASIFPSYQGKHKHFSQPRNQGACRMIRMIQVADPCNLLDQIPDKAIP